MIGSGAFGTTYRAIRDDGRAGALKVLDEAPGDELRALASLCHPCVPGMLDAGSAPRPFLVMELARGEALDRVLREGPLGLERAAATTAALAHALAAVHHAGMTHGDVKPANALIGDGPTDVWLVDFGMVGRRGGTVRYAAPEQGVTGPTAASDVFALGLLFGELLGSPEEGPIPGPPWCAQLLASMTSPDPAARPTAAEVADALHAHGAPLPEVTADLLRRRALTVHVSRPELDAALAAWSAEGGALGVEGGPGSGRTHTLLAVQTEARASGTPLVQLRPGPQPWDAVRDALVDPSLPGEPRRLPDADGDIARAALAAADLAERAADPRLIVLVDDIEELDAGSTQLLRVLVERKAARICVTGRTLPDWITRRVALAPLDTIGTEALIRALLGGGAELGSLVHRVQDASGGVPAAVVEALAAAVEAHALVQRAGRWLVDDARIPGVLRAPAAALTLPALSPAARRVGAALAVAGRPIAIRALRDVSRVDEVEGALQELLEHGLATVGPGRASPTGRAAATALAPPPEEAVALHRELATWLSSLDPVPLGQLGWHLAAARDAEGLAAMGEACVRAAMAVDAADAAAMAEAMAEVSPTPGITAARIDALVAAGRIDDALRLGGESPADTAVLVALARLHGGVRTETELALVHVRRAREMLAGAEPPLSLLEAHAVALHRAGRSAEAAEVCAEALRRPRPEDAQDAARWVQLASIRAQALEKADGAEAALASLDAVEAEGTTRGSLDAVRGYLLLRAGRFHEAAHAMERAVVDGLRASDRARLLANAAVAQYQIGGLRHALASWERALLLFERLSARREAAYVQNNLCVAYRQFGRNARAQQAGEGAVALAGELKDEMLAASALGNLGDVHEARGDHEAARWAWSEAEALLPAGADGERLELLRRRAEQAADAADPEAPELARRLREAAERSENLEERCRSAALSAYFAARSGDVQALEELVEAALPPLQEAGEARALAEVRLRLAEAWLAVDRPDQARMLADRVVAYAAEVGAAPLRARADQIIDQTRGAAPGADRRLARLLDLAVAVSRERELSTLLDAIASAALELLDAERSFVLLCEPGRPHDPVVVASRFREEGEVGAPSMTIVRRAISAGREMIMGDVGERRDIRGAESVVALSLRSALCVPLTEEGEVQGVIYVDSRAITEREWADAVSLLRGLAAHAGIALANARRLELAQKRALVASEIAHDISAPAQLVMCVAEELLEDELPDLPELAEALRAASGQIVEMRRRFLDADDEPAAAPVHLGDLVSRLTAQIGRVARQRGVSVVAMFQRVRTVMGDAHALDRALSNLLLNAVRMSRSGQVVEVALLDGEDGTAVIEVRDRGPGVPPEMMDRIFQRGVHLAGEGHGIGLSIVRRIAAEHGGTVAVRNREGGGAVFTLQLPA